MNVRGRTTLVGTYIQTPPPTHPVPFHHQMKPIFLKSLICFLLKCEIYLSCLVFKNKSLGFQFQSLYYVLTQHLIIYEFLSFIGDIQVVLFHGPIVKVVKKCWLSSWLSGKYHYVLREII